LSFIGTCDLSQSYNLYIIIRPSRRGEDCVILRGNSQCCAGISLERPVQPQVWAYFLEL
jgi:hypothetical protein